ncbi:MAG: DUF4384 domain-containing protein [Myxococcaceae bacterium]
MSCLDDVMLEKVLLAATPEASASAHLATCAKCTARLDRMRTENEAFRRFVFPATVDAVTTSVAPPKWRVGLLVFAPLAIAAALILVVRSAGPADDYVGRKGRVALGLNVFTLDPTGAAVRLAETARVGANAALRFQVRPVDPCYLWVVSTDASGQVSRLYPAEGDAVLVSQTTTLPGGATLDGVAGPERVFAVCTIAPLPFEAVAQAARASSGEAVRRLTHLDGIDGQATVLLEKEAP